MTFMRNRRVVAALVAGSCVIVPVSASASAGSLPATFRTDAAQSGAAASAPSTDRSDAAQSGSDRPAWARFMPADFKGGDSAQRQATAATTYPPSGFRGGDSPVDHPGASRAPATPTTIEVVRPARTIVREVDDALPLILSSAALLLALIGAGFAVTRTRIAPRPGH
jgi:hypothetical protein